MGLYGTGHAPAGGTGLGQGVGANLAYTKFLFVTLRSDDVAAGARLRAAGSQVARGFSNDFDADASSTALNTPRDSQVVESIQFLVRDSEPPFPLWNAGEPRLAAARHVVQVSSRYRPRLEEVEDELKRRLGDAGDVYALNGAMRPPRYSSLELQQYMARDAPPRRSGRVARNAIILPVRKTAEWWAQSPLQRHVYFYPHIDQQLCCPVKGHVHAAEPAIPLVYRRLYHNPDGYQREGEWDFVTYFECEDEALPTFEAVCQALRDPAQNPEWRYVEEGPMWHGRRVLRW